MKRGVKLFLKYKKIINRKKYIDFHLDFQID